MTDEFFGMCLFSFMKASRHLCTKKPLALAGTTVIAVRGTLNALDVLHDVTLWLVPAVLQCLGEVSKSFIPPTYGWW